ncbi:MAG: HmuY family protein [Paraglaciecola sp.]|uniref:HmuY family protein n=1 Tax=Paraglaciecola sp. TaxID=1920173 RepID=UPI0032975ECB
MNKNLTTGLSIGIWALMSACGSSSSNNDSETGVIPDPAPVEEEVVEGEVYGPFTTGSTSEPKSVYFDLETATVLELTDEEAVSDSQWDIAFNRTKVSLNTHAENTVGTYVTDVNSDFYDDQGNALSEIFLNADADTELEDYLAISADDLPDDDAYSIDSEEYVIGANFYNYDFTTHVVSAADDAYFIVSADSAYTKFRAKSLTTSGRTMATITLGVQHQSALDGETEFAPEIDLELDATSCDTGIYVDFDLAQVVNQEDSWDIWIPCLTDEDIIGADFQIFIADEASALLDSENSYLGIDSEAEQYYGFQSNLTTIKAFDSTPWYQYNLNGGHLLWSQYGVYLLKTNAATYKLQITSYYDEAGTSGNYSFRFDELSSD